MFNKRDGFRKAFHDLIWSGVAKFNSKTVERLASDPAIIRNRAKIKATIENAKLILKMEKRIS